MVCTILLAVFCPRNSNSYMENPFIFLLMEAGRIIRRRKKYEENPIFATIKVVCLEETSALTIIFFKCCTVFTSLFSHVFIEHIQLYSSGSKQRDCFLTQSYCSLLPCRYVYTRMYCTSFASCDEG